MLSDVAFGRQPEAGEKAKRDPSLLLLSGTVTDPAGRTFEDITAFQYALWARDRHMWTMILKHLPEKEATKQLHEHVYGDKKYKELHGEHYDFLPLIDELQAYVDNFGQRSDAERTEHWCKKVGRAQKLVAVHVANEYCRPDRSFDPVLTFKETDLPRVLSFFNYLTRSDGSWFSSFGDKSLGDDFGIIRAGARRGMGGVMPWREAERSLDLAAVTALCKVRTQEFVELKQMLLSPGLTKDQDRDPSSSSSSEYVIS